MNRQNATQRFSSRIPGPIFRTGALLVLAIVFLSSVLTVVNFFRSEKVDAAPSSTLTFQARILNLNGSLVADGTYNVEFKIYDSLSSGASAQGLCSLDSSTDDCWWVETRTGGNKVTVKNGYVYANLGSVTAFSSTVPWDQELWITMNIGGTGTPSWDGEMTPRFKVTAVPYALSAANVNSGSTSLPSTHSANVVVKSGNATGTTSNSGSITLDVGTATGTAGTITIGATNASALTLGRSGLTTTNSGAFTVTQLLSANGNTTLGDAVTDNLTLTAAIQGTNALILDGSTDDTNEITLAVTNPGADFTITLPAETGTVCTTGSICTGYASSATAFIQGGNSFSATAILGTNDSNSLILETANTTALTINTLQNATFSGNVVVASGKSLTLTGSGSLPGSPTEGEVYYDSTNNRLLIYQGGQWELLNGANSSTYVVAASNSVNLYAANYRADGTGDQTEINSAITAASTTGGTVYLMEGTYNISASINLASNVRLTGSGQNATRIVAATTSFTMVSVNGVSNSTVSNLAIDGASQGGTYGLVCNGTGARNIFDRLYVHDTVSYPVLFDGSCTDSVLQSSIISSAGSLIQTSNTSTNNRIVNNKLTDTQIYVTAGGEVVSGNNIVNGATTSAIGSASARASITGNAINLTAGGNTSISLANATYNTVSGNATTGGGRGISITGASTYNSVGSNTVSSTGYGIILENTSSHNTINSNVVRSTSNQGIYVGAGHNAVTNNTVNASGGNGIEIPGVSNVQVSDNKIHDSVGSGIVISGNADNNTVSQNTITDTAGSTFAISISASTADNNILQGNIYSGTGASSISDSGTGTIYNNQGRAAGGLNTLFRQSASTSAFTIQNASDSTLLNVDSSTTSNLVTNNSFETNTTGWTAMGGATVSRVTTNQQQGQASLQAATTAASNDGAKYNITLSNSTTYTLSFYAKVSATGGNYLSFGYAQDGSTETGSTTSLNNFITHDSGWLRYSFTFTTSTVSGTPYLFFKQSDATTRNIHIDSVQLETGSSATVFSPGGALQIAGRINSPLNIQPLQDSPQLVQVLSSTSSPAFVVGAAGSTVRVGIGVLNPVSPLQVVLPEWNDNDNNSQHSVFGISSGAGVRIGYNDTTKTGTINALAPGVAWGKLYLQTGGGTLQVDAATSTFTYAVEIKGASSLTLGTASTNTGSILFKGSGSANTLTLSGPTTPSTNTITLPNETGTVCTTGSVCTGYQAAVSGGAANQQLSNLSGTVAINLSLLPGTDDSIDLGDNTHRFRDLYLGGETIHIGTSTTDEATLGYATGANVFSVQNTITGGDIDIDANDAITIDSASISIDGTTSSNLTVTGSGQNLTLSAAGGGAQVLAISSAGTGANALDFDATGTGGGMTFNTTDGAIVITAAGSANGDITLSPTDDFTLDGTAGSLINIGTSSVTQTITIGNATNTDLVLNDANWSVTGAGTATFADIVCNSASCISTGEITTDTIDWTDISDTTTLDDPTTISFTAGSNANALSLNFTNGGAQTSVAGFNIVPTFTLDVADTALFGLAISPNTNSNNDSGDTLYGISVGSIANTVATEYAVRIAGAWDRSIYFDDSIPIIGFADANGSLTIEDAAGNNVLVLMDVSGAGNHILSGDANTGLEINGATTDLTSGDGETLTIAPGGLGALLLSSANTGTSSIGISVAGSGGDLDIDVNDATTIDTGGSVSIDVTAATAASNISVVANADAEDLTIEVTGSAGDLILNSPDQLTLNAGSATSIILSDYITDANAVLYTTTAGALSRVVETETGSLCLLSGAGASGIPVWNTCPGGGASTLQDAYGGDDNDADARIDLTSTDNKLVFSNPASSGSTGDYVLLVEQLSTGAYGGFEVQSAGTGAILRVRDTTATARDVLTIADGGASTFRNQTDSTTAFNVQNAAGTALLTIDSATTSGSRNGIVSVGASDTSATLLVVDTKTDAGDPTGVAGSIYYNSNVNKFRCYSTAWVDCDSTPGSPASKTITFAPEFQNSVIQGDGSSNSGTLLSGFATGLGSTDGYKHNYYEWSTSQSASQDYDIILLHQLPGDFNGTNEFDASSWKVWTYVDSLADAAITMTVYDNDETACANGVSIEGGTTGWEQITLSDFDGVASCDFTANSIITIKITVSSKSPSTNKVRIGEVQYSYTD